MAVSMAPACCCWLVAARPCLRSSLLPLLVPSSYASSFRLSHRVTALASSSFSDNFSGAAGTLGFSFSDDFRTGASSPDETLRKQNVECPPGLRHFETMVVLRPDINEDQRLAFAQRYEEAIIAGGGMGVEVFNRGMMPLAYPIKKKNMAGYTNQYLDGIYYLLTYFTKPEGQSELGKKFNSDDDVIRFSTFVTKPVRA